jgi:hypothetical protein
MEVHKRLCFNKIRIPKQIIIIKGQSYTKNQRFCLHQNVFYSWEIFENFGKQFLEGFFLGNFADLRVPIRLRLYKNYDVITIP